MELHACVVSHMRSAGEALSEPEIAALLRAAEQAHKASGDPDSNWAEWYAHWIAQLVEVKRPAYKEPTKPEWGSQQWAETYSDDLGDSPDV